MRKKIVVVFPGSKKHGGMDAKSMPNRNSRRGGHDKYFRKTTQVSMSPIKRSVSDEALNDLEMTLRKKVTIIPNLFRGMGRYPWI